MKKWILVVGLVLFGALAFAACGDGNDANTELAGDGSLPQVSDDALDRLGDADRDDLVTDGGPVSAVCAPGFPDCVDTVVNGCDGDECAGTDDVAPSNSDCEPVQLRSDCGIDPAVCNQVHNIDACEVEEELPIAPPDARFSVDGQYTVTIRFNETVDQDQMDEVGARIRDFDPDAVYVIQESFPPTGVAYVVAETEDFCLAIVPELEAETFVTSVTCVLQTEPGDPDPDEPVVNDLG